MDSNWDECMDREMDCDMLSTLGALKQLQKDMGSGKVLSEQDQGFWDGLSYLLDKKPEELFIQPRMADKWKRFDEWATLK